MTQKQEHINKLKSIVDRQVQNREEKERIEKQKNEKKQEWEDILNSPDVKRMAFWCKSCELEFEQEAYKSINETYKIGKYQTKCPKCSKWVYRVIGYDYEYYSRSKFIKDMRSEYAKDLLQPGEYGFDTLYGKKWNKQEDTEKKDWKKGLTMQV